MSAKKSKSRPTKMIAALVVGAAIGSVAMYAISQKKKNEKNK